MAGFQLYGHSTCPECQMVQAFFNAHGVPFEPHELSFDTPTAEIIHSAILLAGADQMINSDVARQYGINPYALTSAEMADWLSENPDALRVPIVVRGHHVVPGTDSHLLESMLY